MLWSLFKILAFVVIVAAAAFGAGFLMETGGGVTVQYADIEFALSPIQAAIFVVILVFGVWLLIKLVNLFIALLKFINGDETAFSRYFDRSREQRGFNALSDGLIALANGESKEALIKAKKADRLLNRPDVTKLILAQAAEQSGDTQKAAETYKQLLTHSKTKFVGVQGLLKQKILEGDTATALKLAERAFALKPQLAETQNMLLQLQSTEENWSGARETLAAQHKHGMLPRDVHRRRDGVLALSEARELARSGQVDEAQVLIVEANRLTPGLVPAAVMAARGYLAQEKPRLATKVLQTAWDLDPHPELAATFASINPNEDAATRVKRFRALTKYASNHPETKMLLAELNLAAGDYAMARDALGTLVDDDPTMRSLSIMAAIEKGDGADDDVIHAWLTKALTSARDPEWICDNCGEVHADWEPVCQNCASMDAVVWKRPMHTEQVGDNLLPLLNTKSSESVELVESVEINDDENQSKF